MDEPAGASGRWTSTRRCPSPVFRRDHRAACEASNAIARGVASPTAPVLNHGRTHDLRWAILAVITETARHAGHADIIREQVDGATGR